jgi:hypothetical protein
MFSDEEIEDQKGHATVYHSRKEPGQGAYEKERNKVSIY